MAKENRRQYSAEYKREAVRMSREPGRSVASVAHDLGINENNLWRWREQEAARGADAFPGTGHSTPEQEEIRRLRRELSDVTEERDILKKAISVFSRRPK